jgi:Lon protease-like protein
MPGLVALPGAEIGFHFFEPRYRAMARDLLASDEDAERPRELILAEVVPGEDPRRDDCTLFAIGSLGRVVASEVNRDGTIDVLLSVRARVRLSEIEPRAYRRANVEVLEDVVRSGAALDAPFVMPLPTARCAATPFAEGIATSRRRRSAWSCESARSDVVLLCINEPHDPSRARPADGCDRSRCARELPVHA